MKNTVYEKIPFMVVLYTVYKGFWDRFWKKVKEKTKIKDPGDF